jgi:anti-sigma factor RsiW
MNDCGNAEIRDQLPDLLHDRLDAGARAAALAHVDACADCRDELQLLRALKGTLGRGVPRVDVAYVVGALPKAPLAAQRAPSRAVVPLGGRRRVWTDWRVAAAVTLLFVGGGSYALMNAHGDSVVDTTIVASHGAIGESSALPNRALATATVGESATVATATGGSIDAESDSPLGELNEDQLETLIKDIEGFSAVPETEPAPVTIRIDAKVSLEGV